MKHLLISLVISLIIHSTFAQEKSNPMDSIPAEMRNSANDKLARMSAVTTNRMGYVKRGEGCISAFKRLGYTVTLQECIAAAERAGKEIQWLGRTNKPDVVIILLQEGELFAVEVKGVQVTHILFPKKYLTL
jgi:ABC-type xylose transport system substrate-binding protein